MKKILISAILPLLILGCKRKDYDPVIPSEGKVNLVKEIVIKDARFNNSSVIKIRYNSEGFAEQIEQEGFFYTDTKENSRKIHGTKDITYENGRISSITTSISGEIASDGYNQKEVFEFKTDGNLKTYTNSTTYNTFRNFSRSSVDFVYPENSDFISHIITKQTFPGPSDASETVTDTLENLIVMDAPITNYSELKRNISDTVSCPVLHSYIYDQSMSFSYTESSECKENYKVTGNFSTLKNNLQKPVWDALIAFLPKLEPVRGFKNIAMYHKYLVPDRMVVVENENGTTSQFEYITDKDGNIQSIKEKINGAETRLIEFKY
jgi:hypothetical protein